MTFLIYLVKAIQTLFLKNSRNGGTRIFSIRRLTISELCNHLEVHRLLLQSMRLRLYLDLAVFQRFTFCF